MKIKIDGALKSFDGETLKDVNKNQEMIDAMIKPALVNAILTHVQNETGVEKVTKYELARRIFKSKEFIELSDAEIDLIKTSVGTAYAPVVVGQIFELLDK